MNGLRSAWVSLDLSVLHWVHHHVTPAGVAMFTEISRLGSPVAMGILAVLGAAALAFERRWALLSGWLGAFIGAAVLDTSLKYLIRRPRPPHAAAVLAHTTWSFPSGHALGSLVGFGMLAYLLVVLGTHERRMQRAIVALAAVLVIAVGVSRLYLGVHYFTDVLGGYVVGGLWLGTIVLLLECARRPGLHLHPKD